MKRNNEITLIFRVSNVCNLSCSYCYYDKKLDNSVMNMDVVKTTLEKFSSKFSIIYVVLHGGEPLIQPIKYFEELISIEETLEKTNKVRFRNSIQTNGTIYSKELSHFFRKKKIAIGLSIDGPEEIHNENRHYKNNKNTFEDIVSNISKYTNSKNKVSALVVTTRQVTKNPIRLYNFFKSKKIDFQLNDLINIRSLDSSIVPTNDELADFYSKLFEIWIKDTKAPFINIEPFYSILRKLYGKKQTICTYDKKCFNFISIEPNGNASICGRLYRYERASIGNTLGDSINILGENLHKHVVNSNFSKIPKECSQCRWSSLCNGGCVASAYWDGKGVGNKTYWCDARKIYLKYIYNKLKEIQNEKDAN